MALDATNKIGDFAEDLDDATRALLRQVGPSYVPVWSDVYRGSGNVALAVNVKGHDLLRFFLLSSEVDFSSTPVDEKTSDVRWTGRAKPPEAAGQVIVATPKVEVPHGPAALATARRDLARLAPNWSVAWLRQGTIWPVALLFADRGGTPSYAFVQVATHHPTNVRLVVDARATAAEISAAARRTPAPRSGGGR